MRTIWMALFAVCAAVGCKKEPATETTKPLSPASAPAAAEEPVVPVEVDDEEANDDGRGEPMDDVDDVSDRAGAAEPMDDEPGSEAAQGADGE